MNYDIELNANDSSVLETQYAFTQGDYGQIQFSIRVKADGVYVTNAQRAYIVFTLPNGYVVTGADMSKSVATYTYPFQGSELQVAGTIVADVKLIYTNGQISSNKFSFICRYDPLHDKSFNAGPYISQLQQFLDEAQDKIDYLQTLIETLQPDVGGTTLTRSDLHNTRDAVTAGLKAIDANMAQNMLLRSDITNQVENDANKIAGAASLYSAKADLQGKIDITNSNLSDETIGYTTTLNKSGSKVHKIAKHLWIEGSFYKTSGNFAVNDTVLTLTSPLTNFNSLGSSPCVLRNSGTGATVIGAITCTNGTAMVLTTCPDGYNELRLLNSFPSS